MVVAHRTETASVFEHLPMRQRQWLTVLIAVTLNAIDGFDVVSISLAAPGIAANWQLDPVALGTVLSMELGGMILGSILLSNLADRFGRRRLVLLCVTIMAIGMLLTAFADNVIQLAMLRLVTGIGIGGLVATVTTLASEFSNARWRGLCVSITVVGYSIGIVLGGLASAWLLAEHSWHSIFLLGGIAALICLPVIYLALPESPAFLIARGRSDALDDVNVVMGRLGHAPLAALPAVAPGPQGSYRSLFAPDMRRVTLAVTAAYMAHIFTFYFISKWMPKLLVDAGLSPSEAALHVVIANVGGVLAGIVYGLLASGPRARFVSAGVLIGSFLAVGSFGLLSQHGSTTMAAAITVGVFANAGVAALYTIVTSGFPDRLRATGTGFAIGVGRGAAFIAPILAGWLILSGLSVVVLTILMAVGSLLAAALVIARIDRR